jgi:hypothetical protein
MAKLMRQCKRTKEILSANNEAPISVESIHGEVDFRSSITRGARPCESCACLLDAPVRDALGLRCVCLSAASVCLRVCCVVGVTSTFKSNAEACSRTRCGYTTTSFLKPTRHAQYQQ